MELKKKKTETGLGSKKENSSVDTEREKIHRRNRSFEEIEKGCAR